MRSTAVVVVLARIGLGRRVRPRRVLVLAAIAGIVVAGRRRVVAGSGRRRVVARSGLRCVVATGRGISGRRRRSAVVSARRLVIALGRRSVLLITLGRRGVSLVRTV